MPSEPLSDSQPRRLHPSSLIFALLGAAGNFIVPIVLLAVFSKGESYQYWYIVGVIPVTIGFVVRYISYRYRFGSDELIIREGIFTRNERHVPYARIQNIDLTRNPLHRLLKVAEVRVETASGGKPEAVIRVLSMDAVHVMRQRVFQDTGVRDGTSGEDSQPAAQTRSGERSGDRLVQLSLKEVALYGLFSNRGMVVVAAGFGFLTQAGIFNQDWEAQVTRLLPQIDIASMDLPQVRIAMVAMVGLTFGVLAIMAMRLLSVLLAVFTLYGFRLTQRGDDLRAEFGLLTRITATIPLHRVQLLSIHASRLHRWFGRSSIQVETAGGGAAGEGAEAGRSQFWVAPVIPSQQTDELVAKVLPEIDLQGLSWRPLEARAWKRILRVRLLLLSLVALPPLGLLPLVGWPLLVVLLPLWAVGGALIVRHARRWVREAGYALTSNAIVFRCGWWGRRQSVVGFNKIQAVKWGQSPFDRRHGMATLSVDTAGGGGAGHRIVIPFLSEKVAFSLLNHLSAKADQAVFRW